MFKGIITCLVLVLALAVGSGVAVEAAFLGYVVYFGARAARAGETGDVADAPDVLPTA